MTIEGIVLRCTRSGYTVHAGTQILQCTLRGNLKKQFEFSTSASRARRVLRARPEVFRDVIAVGDRVRVHVSHHGHGVIEEVLPRQTSFSRAGFRGKERTVVCNIDQVAIVFACAEPRLDPWKLDRFLVAAEAESLEPLIVANKCDLNTPEPFNEYAGLGYRVLPTSVVAGIGLEELKEKLKGRVSAFVGPSGVGKSSLLNAIQPGLGLRTAEVGSVTHKGRHTTTTAQLIPLRFGGWVADTPGLRQFEFLDLSPEEIADCFPEFRDVLGSCKFDDCRHASEPGCAIKEAVAAGRISERRYQSYLNMTANLT